MTRFLVRRSPSKYPFVAEASAEYPSVFVSSSLPLSGLVVALLSLYDPSVMVPVFSVLVLTDDVGLRGGNHFATSTTRKLSSYRFLPS